MDRISRNFVAVRSLYYTVVMHYDTSHIIISLYRVFGHFYSSHQLLCANEILSTRKFLLVQTGRLYGEISPSMSLPGGASLIWGLLRCSFIPQTSTLHWSWTHQSAVFRCVFACVSLSTFVARRKSFFFIVV